MDDVNRTDEGLLSRALRTYKAGSPADAIQELESYLLEFPEDKDAATLLGRIYLRTGQPQQSSVWLKHAISIAERNKDDQSLHSAASEEQPITSTDFDIYAGTEIYEAPQQELQLSSQIPDSNPFQYAPTPDVASDQPEVDAINDIPAKDNHVDSQESSDEGTFNDLLDLIEDPLDEPAPAWEDLLAVEDETAEEELQDPGADTTEGLTFEDRAKQEAAKLAVEAGWDRSELEPLVAILTQHRCHAKTIGAMRVLLVEEQATPDELRLLQELRGIWVTYGFNRVYWASEPSDGWQNLSWQMGLILLRTLNCQYSEEALLFLTDTFEDWNTDTNLITIFPAFKYYVHHILNGVAPGSPWWIQRMYDHGGADHSPSRPASEILNIPAYKLLEDYGLLENQGGIESPLEG